MGLLKKLLGGNTLYYPGCLTKFVLPEIQKNYERILRACGINFVKLDNVACCGSPAKNGGYEKTFENIAKKNFETFKRFGIERIVTNCPACFHILAHEYPKVVDGWDIKVEHTTVVLWESISNGRIGLKKVKGKKITYHDPCHLGRYSGIYEEPRKILESIGYEIEEMEFCKENSFCCGGGGGVSANFPSLAKNIARERIQQAVKTKAKILTTACPLCYLTLKKESRGKIKVVEISELIVTSLR